MDAQTAWQTGLLIGWLHKHGIKAIPIIEGQAYTDTIEVVVEMPATTSGAITRQKIRVKVVVDDE